MKNIRTRHPGLTLIELAAVCSALALLATVLRPALIGTRQRAQSAQCLANLQRIASASEGGNLVGWPE